MSSLARLFAACLTAILFAAGMPPRAGADAPAPVIIVMDGSGSMWGNLGTERTAKFDLARAALRQSLATVTSAARFGLVAYGHRSRGNCSDVETLVPPEAGPAERVLGPIDKLSPRGRGPLTLALREAAKSVPGQDPATFILVTDGYDNCSQDPCLGAAEIAKANPNIVIHTIALAVDPPADLQRLRCISRTTRGKFYDIRDNAALPTAVGEVTQLANLQGPAAQPEEAAAPEAAPKSAPPGLRLSAALAEKGAAITAPVSWRISKEGAEDQAVLERSSPAISENIAPGRYVVEATYGLAKAKTTVEVTEEGPAAARLSFDAGTLKIEARASQALDPLADPMLTVSALPAAGSDGKSAPQAVWIGRNADAEIVLPAGSYRVRATDGLAQAETTVAVTAGAAARAPLVLSTGRLELTAVPVENGDPLTEVEFAIAVDDPDAPQGRREIARTADPHPVFVLAAGTYYVSARLGTAEVHQRVAVGTGAVVVQPIVLNVSRVIVSALLDGAAPPRELPVTFRVLSSDPSPRELARNTNTPAEFFLAAGKYRIEAQAGPNNIKAAIDTDITPGKEIKIALKLESGAVTIKPTDTQAGHWEVKDGGGRTVLRSGQSGTKTARLAPGRYVVRVSGGTTDTAFDLKAGEQRTVEVSP